MNGHDVEFAAQDRGGSSIGYRVFSMEDRVPDDCQSLMIAIRPVPDRRQQPNRRSHRGGGRRASDLLPNDA